VTRKHIWLSKPRRREQEDMPRRPINIVVILLIVGLSTAFAQAPPPVSFLEKSAPAAGTSPQAVAVGDFNGDGKLDLAVTNSTNVGVLLGNGDGTFQPAVYYSVGSSPRAVAVGDFNGDGKLDLVVGNVTSGNVSVLLGNGDGTFQPALNYAADNAPYSVAVGDFNGDGKLDVAAAEAGGSAIVSVFLGKGDGTFQPAVNYGVGQDPVSLAVGDFNGDGNLDVAAATQGGSDTVSVLLGKGDGTFQPAVNYAAGSIPSSVVAGDFNGDGKLDLAVTNIFDDTVSVLLGNGDGTFQAPVNYDTGAYPWWVAVGDFNGDGKPDLAAANGNGNDVSILLNTTAYLGPAIVESPAPNSTLNGSAVTFQWTPSDPATAYWIDVGSAAGGNQYYQSGSLGTGTRSATITSLPTNGSTVYATVYSLIGGQWVSNTYTYAGFNVAMHKGVITSPVPSSSLSGNSVTFSWTAGPGATAYWLDAGNVGGGSQYHQSENLGNVLTTTVNGLPGDGSTVYVTLYSLVNGHWLNNAYTYTAFNNAAHEGVITSPVPSSTLGSSSIAFSWTAATGATAYWLDAGSSAGGNQYHQSGNLGNLLTTTVNGLPTNGSTVFVALYSLVNGQWIGNAFTYTALNATSGLAVMQTPVPGTTLSGNSATFTWAAGTAASAYWVDIGTVPGGNSIYSSGNLGSVLTTTVSSLPANGSTIYVTLYSLVGGEWLNNSHTYVSGP
jgi:FG-GAP-like repeat